MRFSPFYTFPYPNYYRRPYPYKPVSNINQDTNKSIYENVINHSDTKVSSKDNEENSNTRVLGENKQNEKISPKRNSFTNFNISSLFSSNLDEPVLEILGISLFLDDILIICLLFFLYTEGVKDDMLFICLILLLLG